MKDLCTFVPRYCPKSRRRFRILIMEQQAHTSHGATKLSNVGCPCKVTDAMPCYSPVTHVIFDVDGLLLDTEGIYFRIRSAILEEYGETYHPELREIISGATGQESARILIEHFHLPLTIEEFMQQQKNALKDSMPFCELMPGAERLIRHFHEKNIPIAIATSSTIENVNLKITKYRPLFSLMHHIVCAGSDPEVEHGKPQPDVFLVCASRFDDNPHPSKVLVFEDTPNGVQAALAAGMQVVMVPEDHISTEKTQAATLVLSSLSEFQPQLFGLPPFN